MMKAIWNRRNSSEGGFTLVELLVVIAILGILAGVAVFAIGGTNAKSKTAACKSDKATIQTASDAYYAENPLGTYAGGIDVLVSSNYLRSLPGTLTPATNSTSYANNGYTLTYATSTGVVSGTC